MFHLLLQKALTFAQLYDETKDPSLLTNCESIPQYKELLRTLQKFTLKDLLLEDSMIKESFAPGTISAATVVEDSMISVGYFFIPAGMRLSLHDHPGMLVTSKILKGEIQRRAFDLVDREKQFELPITPINDIEENPYAEIKLDAILESHEIFEEGELINLTPISGNIHSFVAIKDTVIMDVLTPYYDQETRFCNFYIEADPSKTKPTKKIKKEANEEDKLQKGYKASLIYLSEPPRIPFKIIGCSEALIKGPTTSSNTDTNTIPSAVITTV